MLVGELVGAQLVPDPSPHVFDVYDIQKSVQRGSFSSLHSAYIIQKALQNVDKSSDHPSPWINASTSHYTKYLIICILIYLQRYTSKLSIFIYTYK